MAAQGTEELRPGLIGARVPGAVGADGGSFYMVKGDAASVLRCRHGQTTHTLGAQTRERQRYAAGLVAAALLGHRLAGRGPRAARSALRTRLPRVVCAGCSWDSWRRCTRHARPEGRGGVG